MSRKRSRSSKDRSARQGQTAVQKKLALITKPRLSRRSFPPWTAIPMLQPSWGITVSGLPTASSSCLRRIPFRNEQCEALQASRAKIEVAERN